MRLDTRKYHGEVKRDVRKEKEVKRSGDVVQRIAMSSEQGDENMTRVE